MLHRVEIFVYSRAAIERVPPHDVPHIVISITTTEDDRARIPSSPHCKGVLRLVFHDADAPTATSSEEALFSAAHADAIWDFVLAHRADVERVILHCDAGVSRSPGVAAAVSKALLGDAAEYFRRYRPNMLVYRTLLKPLPRARRGVAVMHGGDESRRLLSSSVGSRGADATISIHQHRGRGHARAARVRELR